MMLLTYDLRRDLRGQNRASPRSAASTSREHSVSKGSGEYGQLSPNAQGSIDGPQKRDVSSRARLSQCCIRAPFLPKRWWDAPRISLDKNWNCAARRASIRWYCCLLRREEIMRFCRLETIPDAEANISKEPIKVSSSSKRRLRWIIIELRLQHLNHYWIQLINCAPLWNRTNSDSKVSVVLIEFIEWDCDWMCRTFRE